MFSSRSNIDRRLNPLAEALQAARNEGREFVDLTVSNPTLADFTYPDEVIRRALSNNADAVYRAESLGLPEAREAVATEFDWDANRVIITSSTSEAYSLLFQLLADPGDCILTPRPGYPLLEHLVRFAGLREESYRSFYDGCWTLDHQSLLSRDQARAVVTVSPNNPTGEMLSPNHRDALLSLGKPLIVDEVFFPYGLDSSPPAQSAVADIQTGLAFSLGGLSKYAGLPHMKLAWILVAGDPAIVAEALSRLSIVADAYLSPNQMTQLALPVIFESTRGVRDAICNRTRRNLNHLRQSCRTIPSLSTPKIDGGWYAPLRLPAIHTEEEWCLRLLKDNVLVHPGYFYDFDDQAYVVLSLLTPPKAFALGVERLLGCLERERL